MKRLIIALVVVLCIGVVFAYAPATAEAGTYTITTTAEQDAQLDTVAEDYGITKDVLVQSKFVDHLAEALAIMDRKKQSRIFLQWGSLTEAEKNALIAVLPEE